MKTDFAKDEEFDREYLNELLRTEKNYLKIAEKLSARFTQKYGSEFSGFVKVDVDIVHNIWRLHFGKEHAVEFDSDEFMEIPSRVRFEREKRSRKK